MAYKKYIIKIILISILLSLSAGCIQQIPTGYKSKIAPAQEELRIAGPRRRYESTAVIAASAHAAMYARRNASTKTFATG